MASQQVFAFPDGPLLGNESPIPGLTHLPQFLSDDEATDLHRWVYARPASEWSREIARRVIHYGWRYDYQARRITSDLHLGELPDELTSLAERLLLETGTFKDTPNQVIVNEYVPGQGLAMHTDHPDFGPTVATVSLGDSWGMEFSHERTGRKVSKLLEVGSALVLSGEARSEWQHGISKRKTEPGGRPRSTRVSLTFRTVNLS